MSQTHVPRVVIVGGGFGGLNAARSLSRLPVEITLIDKRNFHLFQPLLYQVATGGLSPADIAAPLRDALRDDKNVTVLLDEVISIDPLNQCVAAKSGRLHYDFLIVATGAVNHYFDNDTWSANAPALKTIEDATDIRRRILQAFENAERETDPELRREWLRFVIVGAGPTGVELAGAIGEIATDTLRRSFRRIRPGGSEIFLVEGGPRVLPTFPSDLSTKAERSLIRLGVRTITGVIVTRIEDGSVTMKDSQGAERQIDARTVIWAAGVRASPLGRPLAEALGAEIDNSGRVHVSSDLSIPNHPEIFVIGDLAWCDQAGQRLPGTCPVAMQQGWYTADVIGARLTGKATPPFRYNDKGTMATIGRNKAVVDLGWIRFGGTFAWLTWLFIHLLYLVSYRSRILVAIQWAFQYFSFNRSARIITEQPGAPER